MTLGDSHLYIVLKIVRRDHTGHWTLCTTGNFGSRQGGANITLRLVIMTKEYELVIMTGTPAMDIDVINSVNQS